MDIGDWITLGAVIVALGIGVASIVATVILRVKDIQREHKRLAIQDVLSWAEKSYKLFYDLQYVYSGSEEYFDSKEQEKYLTILWAEKDAIMVAAQNIDKKLSEMVNLVKNTLDDYWKNKGGWKPDKVKSAENELERLFAFLFKRTAETKVKLNL